jgi:hypothetical protein
VAADLGVGDHVVDADQRRIEGERQGPGRRPADPQAGTEPGAAGEGDRVRRLGRLRAQMARMAGKSEEEVQKILDDTQRKVNRIVETQMERMENAGATRAAGDAPRPGA